MAAVEKDDVFTYAEHGVHVVGVDDGGDAIFMGDVAQKLINENGGAGVEPGIGLVAKKVAGVEGYGAGYGHAFLHASGNLGGIFGVGARQADALQAEAGAREHLGARHVGKHDQREHDVAKHRLGIKQRRPLKEHADFAAQGLDLRGGHAQQVAPVVENLAAVGADEPHERFHQHRLARPALADDEVGLAGEKCGVDVVEYGLAVEALDDLFHFNHCIISLVRITSSSRMRMLLETTALVLALPTSRAPPRTW